MSLVLKIYTQQNKSICYFIFRQKLIYATRYSYKLGKNKNDYVSTKLINPELYQSTK